MGMSNPHDAEGSLRDSAMEWMKSSNKDPHSQHHRDNAEYYLDQWFKMMEKRVRAELTAKKVKETAGDKPKKIKPKPEIQKEK